MVPVVRRVALAIALLAAPPAPVSAAAGWSAGEPRPFLAWRGELGTAAHLQAVAGWGKPWWTWAGLSADAWANENVGAITVGLRASLLVVDLDVHWRGTRGWERVPMPPLERHREILTGRGSSYQAVDASLSGVLPLLGGFLLWEGVAVRTLDLPSGVHVMDESLHAIVAPPLAGLVSVGWVANLRGGALQAGGTVERIFTSRGGEPYLRAGPTFSWALGHRWGLRGSLLIPLSSPDALPLWPSLGGGLLLGYRDATRRGPTSRGAASRGGSAGPSRSRPSRHARRGALRREAAHHADAPRRAEGGVNHEEHVAP